MKRKFFIIVLMLATVTAFAGGDAPESDDLPVTIDIYVYIGTTEGTGTIKIVITITVTSAPTTGPTGNVTVKIKDTRTNTVVNRIGRDASGNPYILPTATTVNVTAVTIP